MYGPIHVCGRLGVGSTKYALGWLQIFRFKGGKITPGRPDPDVKFQSDLGPRHMKRKYMNPERPIQGVKIQDDQKSSGYEQWEGCPRGLVGTTYAH